MSHNRLDLGLDQLRKLLQLLPEALAQEGGQLVEATTDVAEFQLYQAYPPGPTGNLRKGVSSDVKRSRFGVNGTLRSKAPHAWLYEFGTANRTYHGMDRGRSPSHENTGLVAVAVRNRKRLREQLIALVERAGFQVT